jgi:hypothetical protein
MVLPASLWLLVYCLWLLLTIVISRSLVLFPLVRWPIKTEQVSTETTMQAFAWYHCKKYFGLAGLQHPNAANQFTSGLSSYYRICPSFGFLQRGS